MLNTFFSTVDKFLNHKQNMKDNVLETRKKNRDMYPYLINYCRKTFQVITH